MKEQPKLFNEPELNIVKRIMLALGNKARMFRNNTAMGWVGEILIKTPFSITLGNYRPLHAGLHKGSSDLIGFTMVTITKEMVGRQAAIFTAIEVKTPKGRPSPDQINFINAIKLNGGFAGIARTEEEANEICQGK